MQKTTDIKNLVWFRNDLRTRDNVVLKNACKNNEKVIGIYCLDPRHFEEDEFGFKKTEKFRTKFLLETLRDLKQQLKDLNIELFVYNDKPENKIPELVKSHTIDAIYVQNEWTKEEKTIENTVKSKVNSDINWYSEYDQFLYHPNDISIDVSKIPQVFTVFRKKLEKHVDIRQDVRIDKQPESNRVENNTEIPTLKDLGFDDFEIHPHSAFPFKGGETNALKRLDNYFFNTKKLGYYKKTRNGLVGVDYSSKFSPWLANGSLSARSIYWEIKKFEEQHYSNQSTYWLIFELIWRDYFKYISLKYGNQIFKLRGILDKNYDWDISEARVKKWIDGETQSDFVNANMLEIKHTGWMSNRGRQNVASYFAKDLKLDWRMGAAYFESLLIDYDVHSNYGNWMYVAGVGNDPRNRKFNVKSQADRYDENGNFRKLWLQPGLF